MLVLVVIALIFWVHSDSIKDAMAGAMGLFITAALWIVVIALALSILKGC